MLWTKRIILPQSVVDLLDSIRDDEAQEGELELENSTDCDDDDEDWCTLRRWWGETVETMLNLFKEVLWVHLII